MSKRYTVISQLTKRGPEYRIYDRVNNATIEGGFETQKWAESVAEMMEEKYARANKHVRPDGSRPDKDAMRAQM